MFGVMTMNRNIYYGEHTIVKRYIGNKLVYQRPYDKGKENTSKQTKNNR